MANERPLDIRTAQNTQHSMTALLRQSIYGRLAGYEDTNAADRLCMPLSVDLPPKIDPMASRQVKRERFFTWIVRVVL